MNEGCDRALNDTGVKCDREDTVGYHLRKSSDSILAVAQMVTHLVGSSPFEETFFTALFNDAFQSGQGTSSSHASGP